MGRRYGKCIMMIDNLNKEDEKTEELMEDEMELDQPVHKKPKQ